MVRRREERGYVAVLVALLTLTLVGISAFAVDAGHWYLVGQEEQRAADAAAMAGVTMLPGDVAGAYSLAQQYSGANGFTNGSGATTVTTNLDGGPTRLRVTVQRQVSNIFGPLLGVDSTTVTKTAVADYAGPVPMGSPCNEFGDDPDGTAERSADCSTAGAFWANIGSLGAPKSWGDAFQDGGCANGVDGCSGGTNTDFDPNGYIYLVTLRQPVSGLHIQAFDPAQVYVGDYCTASSANLTGASKLGKKADVPDASTRYAPGSTAYCTGDQATGSGLVQTQFTVHAPGANAWDPLGWPTLNSTTFEPFNGDLSKALDHTSSSYRPDVAADFRRWVDLYTTSGVAPAGTYAIQVKTNGLGSDSQGGHNRFALRAFGSSSSDKDNISISAFNKMAIYGNTPNGTSRFFLARVPNGAAGQILNVHLFDIGDGATSGSTITVVPPVEYATSFSGCTASGVVNGSISNCTIPVSGAYNGKWQTISVPIPTGYTCDMTTSTGCWVRLRFYYGPGSSPNDTTSWTASIDGDPIRLVE